MSRVLLCVVMLMALVQGLVCAELKTMNNTAEFNKVLAEAQVPVIVQFSAYWCGPCQRLKAKMEKICPDYQDSQVLVYYVDAYVNSDLKKYLDGGYPTVRCFFQNKMKQPYFVGDTSEAEVRQYIDKVIQNTSDAPEVLSSLKTLNTSEEFTKAIAEAQVPVIVQFSAYWCGPCQRLKAKMEKICADYQDSQVLIYYVDAYVNTDLKKYLDGGYPTVRSFFQNKMKESYFVGDKAESEVRQYINKVIQSNSGQQMFSMTEDGEEGNLGSEFVEFKTKKDFNLYVGKLDDKTGVVAVFGFGNSAAVVSMKNKFIELAKLPEYSRVKFAYGDAHNDLAFKEYFLTKQTSDPHIRTFNKGKTQNPCFSGDREMKPLKAFVDNFIENVLPKPRMLEQEMNFSPVVE